MDLFNPDLPMNARKLLRAGAAVFALASFFSLGPPLASASERVGTEIPQRRPHGVATQALKTAKALEAVDDITPAAYTTTIEEAWSRAIDVLKDAPNLNLVEVCDRSLAVQ